MLSLSHLSSPLWRAPIKQVSVLVGTLSVLALAPTAMADSVVSTKTATQTKSTYTKVATKTEPRGQNRDRARNRDRGHSRNTARGHARNDSRNLDSRRHDSRGHQNSRHSGHGERTRDRRNRDRHYSNRHNSRQYNRGYNTRVYNRGYRNVFRPYRSSYYTPYRSGLGISFNFGSPRYTGYRWASSPYSLYRTSFGSYGGYQSATICRRVNRLAYHHGHEELISVKECSNPWSGTYIVQGSERLINCRY